MSGASIGWEGQITVYGYANGPCYRCLYPICPKANSVRSCNESGVIGMMPGVVGVLLALETLKILVGLPNVLSQHMFLIDGQIASVKKIKIRGK